MAKKGFGKLVAFAAVAGATAAGISYLKKYKSFNDELEEEFHDFEGSEENDDDFFEEEETVTIVEEGTSETEEPKKDEETAQEPNTAEKYEETTDPRASRKYIPLNVSKDELKLAAKDMVSAAGEIAGAAKSVLKDAAVILSDTAHDAAVVAKDTAQIARAKLSERAELHRNRQNEESPSSNHTATSATHSQGNSQSSAAVHEDTPTEPAKADESPSPETENEKAWHETAAAQFDPHTPTCTAGLETEAQDSVLEVVNPEDAQKVVLETEATAAIENLDVEELDD